MNNRMTLEELEDYLDFDVYIKEYEKKLSTSD